MKRTLPIFLLIIIAAAFLRFYNFTNRISIGTDSARDAFVSLYGAQDFQLPITGPFTSIAPVTTGPWYWTQLILARLILPTPYAPWILLGVYSVFHVFVLYLVGYFIEGKRLGYILAFLAAFASAQIDTATELTNPSVIGFYTSIYILLFVLLVKGKKENLKLGFLAGLILGISINTHYQAAGLISLIMTLVFFGKKYLKTLAAAILGMGLSFLPLLCFELNNHWYNTRHILQYILVDQYKLWTPMRWLTYISDYWPDFIAFVIGSPKIFGTFILILLSVGYAILIWKRKLPKVLILLAVSFFVGVVIVRYRRGERFYGYLQFFHPYLFIFIGFLINKTFSGRVGKFFGIAALGAYFFFIFPLVRTKFRSNEFTLQTKNMAEKIYKTFGPGPYKLYKCQNSVKPDIISLSLQFYMDNKYDSGGKQLIYKWGCSLPPIEESKVPESVWSKNLEAYYPKIDNIINASIASPAAILAGGWVEASPKSMYQSAARWWMDEQP